MRIEQQITKCKEENKACAMMESPAEGKLASSETTGVATEK